MFADKHHTDITGTVNTNTRQVISTHPNTDSVNEGKGDCESGRFISIRSPTLERDLDSSIYTGTELTQVPIRDCIIIVQFVIIIFLFLYPVALVLLGNCAGTVEAGSDVLLAVGNGLVFLDVPLTMNIQEVNSYVA